MFDKSAGQIEYDGALSLSAGLVYHLQQGNGFTGSGGSDQHRMALFKPPGITNTCNCRGSIIARRIEPMLPCQSPTPA